MPRCFRNNGTNPQHHVKLKVRYPRNRPPHTVQTKKLCCQRLTRVVLAGPTARHMKHRRGLVTALYSLNETHRGTRVEFNPSWTYTNTWRIDRTSKSPFFFSTTAGTQPTEYSDYECAIFYIRPTYLVSAEEIWVIHAYIRKLSVFVRIYQPAEAGYNQTTQLTQRRHCRCCR